MDFNKIDAKLKVLAKKYSELMSDVLLFVRQCLSHKKIVIISDKGISSVPVSFKTQASVLMGFLTFMLWVSYSTGRYFAYESIISEKDREIWTTSVNNENLQYQVADLHENLKELNKYFENIQQYTKAARAAASAGGKVSSGDKKDDDISKRESDVNSILQNIKGKVVERIGSLESVIKMTGLKVDDVAAHNSSLKRVLIKPGDHSGVPPVDASNQGGPYIPLEEGGLGGVKFDKEVNYLLELEKVVHSFPLSAPMEVYKVSSGFGGRVDPIRGGGAFHSGVDLVAPYGSEVRTPAPGVVVHARMDGAYGRMVEVYHGSGITTRYGHLNQILVKEGQKVEKGKIVGLEGSTGRSTGAHLHYEVRYNGKPLDPENFLNAGKYVF